MTKVPGPVWVLGVGLVAGLALSVATSNAQPRSDKPKGGSAAQRQAGAAKPTGGLSGVEFQGTQSFPVPAGGTSELIVTTCPGEKLAISGGFSASKNVFPVMSMPTTSLRSWQLIMQNTGTKDATVTTFVLCAPGAP